MKIFINKKRLVLVNNIYNKKTKKTNNNKIKDINYQQ